MPKLIKFIYLYSLPIGSSNIALMGDKEKFVPCGKKRVKQIIDENQKLTAIVILANGEEDITLFGYAPHQLKATAENCRIENTEYDTQSKKFSITIAPKEDTKWIKEQEETIAEALLTLELE